MRASRPWEKNWVRQAQSSLGRGGQGHTFLVHARGDPSLRAVLKVQIERKERDPTARRRMFTEVAALKAVANAGADVPKVLEDNTASFQDQDTPLFFIMEFAEGATLEKEVKTRGHLSLDEAVRVTLSVLATLKIAFAEGFVHRDLKPDNLMIRQQDGLKVTVLDFGLSFNRDDDSELTRTNEAIENSFVTLPETRGPQENKRDPRSDITSACAIFFFCITGCAPKNLIDSQGRAPHRTPHSTPEKSLGDSRQMALISSLLDRGLRNEIDLRFQTVAELEERLEEIVDSSRAARRESLLEVASQQAMVLRKRDRKTQLAELRKVCEPLHMMLFQKGQELARQLSQSSRFGVTSGGQSQQYPLTFPKGIDPIGVDSVSSVALPEHDLNYQIHYWAGAEGLEGHIYRCVCRGAKRPGIFGPRTKEASFIVEPWEIVLRFSGAGADLGVVAEDFEYSIARMLPRLAEDVCSGANVQK